MQSICNINQLSDFYMTVAFIISYCRINCNNYTDCFVMPVTLFMYVYIYIYIYIEAKFLFGQVGVQFDMNILFLNQV